MVTRNRALPHLRMFRRWVRRSQAKEVTMARIYTKDVFNEVVAGTTTQFSDQADYDLLGRADYMSIQIHVANATGTNPTITIKLWGSNDGGKNWVTIATPWSVQTLTVGGIFDDIEDTGSAVLPALLKFEVQLGVSGSSAYVKISVNGRTH